MSNFHGYQLFKEKKNYNALWIRALICIFVTAKLPWRK